MANEEQLKILKSGVFPDPIWDENPSNYIDIPFTSYTVARFIGGEFVGSARGIGTAWNAVHSIGSHTFEKKHICR